MASPDQPENGQAKPKLTVAEVLERPGLSLDVARSMLAAVALGKTSEVSSYLWMRLLNTYIEMADEEMVSVPRSALHVVLWAMEEDCRLDHDGNCQAHLLDQPCSIAVLRGAFDGA